MKIVSIGDGYTGKTCLLIKLTQNTFVRDYVPTDSFENITAKCVEKVKEHKASCPGAKLFVMGAKTDLRTDEGTIANLKAKGQHPITYKEGVELAKKIGAQKYVECSAKTENLKEVFIEIIQEYFESKSKVKMSAAMCCWKAGEPGQSEVVHISDG